jgi:hypothetical protein
MPLRRGEAWADKHVHADKATRCGIMPERHAGNRLSGQGYRRPVRQQIEASELDRGIEHLWVGIAEGQCCLPAERKHAWLGAKENEPGRRTRGGEPCQEVNRVGSREIAIERHHEWPKPRRKLDELAGFGGREAFQPVPFGKANEAFGG